MNISTKGRYAIRALVELAKVKDNQVLSVKDISDIQGISTTYLEHLMVKLKKAKIVGSQRGAKGGFFLKKKPKDITLCDVILAVEGPVFLSKCLNSKNTTIGSNRSNISKGFYTRVYKAIKNTLKRFMAIYRGVIRNFMP